MTILSVDDVLSSGAVAILCELERDGFTVELTPDDAITVAPRAALTPDRRQQIIEHKVAIKILLRSYDSGVRDRRELFARQLDSAPPGVLVPRFVFRPSPYVPGRCHACGEGLGCSRWGFCWRCALARSLVCRAPIPANVFKVYDEARVCALATYVALSFPEPHLEVSRVQ